MESTDEWVSATKKKEMCYPSRGNPFRGRVLFFVLIGSADRGGGVARGVLMPEGVIHETACTSPLRSVEKEACVVPWENWRERCASATDTRGRTVVAGAGPAGVALAGPEVRGSP